MRINKNPKKIEETLTRRVAEVIPGKKELASLMKKKIKVYLGIDPTGGNLHLGHTIPLKKLQEFAALGHDVTLLIGTGTVLTGDPSLRSSKRADITEKEVRENIKGWKKQAGKILDFSKVKIRYNGDWLLKLKLKDIINIASNISAIKLFQREMFQRRIKNGDTVFVHETLYPLLQGYDSVVMDVDLEIGGTDQVFNMLIGRELQKKINNREKFIITVPMALGTDGRQMSKTSGNCIWISDSPNEMFGKAMSISDNLIISYFELFTDVPSKKIKEYKEKLRSKKVNPIELKRKLAFEIVKDYHSEGAARKAEKEFGRVFREKRIPSKMRTAAVKDPIIDTCSLLVKINLASSRAEARRLILQGGVKIDGKVKNDWKEKIKIKKGQVIQVGKRRFVKIK